MQPIKTALASFGMSGMLFHAPFLHNSNGFEIHKILERHSEKSKKKYPYAKIVRDYNDLFRDDNTELIIVNTPDHTHYELTKKAIMAGKHVVVEKPFTLKYSDAIELAELADKKSVMLSVYQNRRWDGDFMTVKKIVEQQLLGRLVEFESRFDRYRNYIRPGSWKEDASTGTGTLYNIGSHIIDQALVLFGKPGRVIADMRIMRTGGTVDDSFELWLGYNDIKVSVRASYLAREPGPRFLLHGTEGSFIKWGVDPQETDLQSGDLPCREDWGREDEEAWGVLNTSVGSKQFRGKFETIHGNYSAFYDNIYSVIRNGATLEVSADQAAFVVKIIEAAIASWKTGRAITV